MGANDEHDAFFLLPCAARRFDFFFLGLLFSAAKFNISATSKTNESLPPSMASPQEERQLSKLQHVFIEVRTRSGRFVDSSVCGTTSCCCFF